MAAVLIENSNGVGIHTLDPVSLRLRFKGRVHRYTFRAVGSLESGCSGDISPVDPSALAIGFQVEGDDIGLIQSHQFSGIRNAVAIFIPPNQE